MAAPSPLTIVFLGATGGCGLSALRHALAAGHSCIALCRTPARLEASFADAPGGVPANLAVRQGNAHDVDAVAGCLMGPEGGAGPGRLADAVCLSVGARVRMPQLAMDDAEVCSKAAAALLAAVARVRAGAGTPAWRPLLAAVSTTGIAAHGRDVALGVELLYCVALRGPHADKRAMERRLAAGGERVVVVRPSLLVGAGAGADAGADRPVREHVEGPGGVERRAVGVRISRDAVGRWLWERVLRCAPGGCEYEGKAVGLTW